MPRTSLASWDAKKQQRYTAEHGLTIHLLLDASWSMLAHARALEAAYLRYFTWLKGQAPGWTQLDQRLFAETVPAPHAVPLHEAVPLRYAPEGGTALYDALGATMAEEGAGDHLLIAFSDGHDEDSRQYTALNLPAMLAARPRWTMVFLGAFPDALRVGLALGCAEGNCLVFGSAGFPKAFAQLQAATARYLAGTSAERRLLGQSGLF